jgi:hypothetical protein
LKKLESAHGKQLIFCSNCGKQHTGIPFSFAADYPDVNADFSREVRDARIVEDMDHPLSAEQINGLNRQKAEQYSCLLLRQAKL